MQYNPNKSLKEIEITYILKAIEYTNGNLTNAAKNLDISRATIFRKVKDYNLKELVNEMRQTKTLQGLIK